MNFLEYDSVHCRIKNNIVIQSFNKCLDAILFVEQKWITLSLEPS